MDADEHVAFHVQVQDHHFWSQVTHYVERIVATRPCPHNFKTRSPTEDRLHTFQQKRVIINKRYGNHSTQPSLFHSISVGLLMEIRKRILYR
jgi:hypothetical protein